MKNVLPNSYFQLLTGLGSLEMFISLKHKIAILIVLIVKVLIVKNILIVITYNRKKSFYVEEIYD
jgi:hypothetical protein